MTNHSVNEKQPLSKKLRYLVSAVLLGISCTAVGVGTLSQNHGTVSVALGETRSLSSVKTAVTDAYGDGIAYLTRWLNLYGRVQNILGTSVYEDSAYRYVIRDKAGYLHFDIPRADATPYADAVAKLRDALATEGIPFLYIQAPTRQIEGVTELPTGVGMYALENANAMYDALCERGVDVLSLNHALTSSDLPTEERFYKTDHHWTTQAAFTAFGITAEYLNEVYGFSLDTSLCDRAEWNSITQESCFLGSIGRRIGEELAGLDDYTYMEPAFETAYDIYHPPTSRETPYWSGDFHETMVRDSLLYSDDIRANRYASYFQWDYPELIIRNRNQTEGLRIVILKDSFALPFTAFLSTAVSEIISVDLREFEGNVTDYLLEVSPDIVLILYSGGSFLSEQYRFFGETE